MRAAHRAGLRTAVVGVVVAALTATGAVSVPAAAAPGESGRSAQERSPGSRPLQDVEKTTPLRSTTLTTPPSLGSAERAMRSAPLRRDAQWPSAGTVALDASDDTAGAGPVELTREPADAAGAAPDAGAAPAEDVAVTVLDRSAADKAGIDGVLLTVDGEAQGVDGVGLRIDYSAFAGAYGADWASRLTVVRLPDCVLTTPERAECRVPTPLSTSNDRSEQTVVADLGSAVPDAAPATPPAPAPAPEPAPADGAATPTPAPSAPSPTPATAPEEPAPSATPSRTPAPSAEPTPTAVPKATAPEQTPVPSPSVTDRNAPTPDVTDVTARAARTGTSTLLASSARTARVRPAAYVTDGATSRAGVAAATGASTLGVLAVTAAASGPAGNWGATPMSASSTWQVSPQTGDFTWSYPMQAPPATGGPEPELALSYASGSLDGKTAGQNTQSSWVGDGWDMSTGFIERRYVPCAQDRLVAGANNASTITGDLCWGGYNATMSFGGRGGELVRDAATNAWKLKSDDGTRIELLGNSGNGDNNGEYWKVTTTDGTQYFFGRGKRSDTDTTALNSAWLVPVYGNHAGEPCNATTYAASICMQAWRWNLEYVVDVHGNSMTYFYEKEENRYTRNNGSGINTYTRGGYLSRIDYGQRAGSETANAPQRVEITVAERCLPSGSITCDPAQLSAATASSWPDTPLDLICDSTTSCPETSPSFFTRKRLTGVTTKVWNGTAYQSVDSWTLTHTYPDPGDTTSPALWLSSIQQQGLVGTAITVPRIAFTGEQKANRVDTTGDAGPPMNRYRVTVIDTDSGGKVSVRYKAPDCAAGDVPASPDTNTRRCFPVRWTPEGSSTTPILEYFHKYVVESVVTNAGALDSSIPLETRYEYQGTPAWHYDDNPFVTPENRTWGEYRGYAVVDVYTGATTTNRLRTRFEHFRGMHGDKVGAGTRTDTVGGVADEEHLNGFLYAKTIYDGTTVVSVEKNLPWSTVSATGADGQRAHRMGTASTEITTYGSALPTAGRTTRTVTTFDPTWGLPTQVDDQGDVAVATDDRCTRIEYVRNLTTYVTGTVGRSETVGVGCGATPARPGDVLTDTRTAYDGGAFGAAPTRGLVTGTQELSGYSGSTPTYVTRATSTYDAQGRITTVTDAAGRATTTAYTPATGGPLTRVVTTTPDPDGSGPQTALVTTTDVEPSRGTPLKQTDPNGKVISATQDALGRTTQVWMSDRTQGTHTPTTTYEYTVNAGGVNAITTKSLTAAGTYQASVVLYDGLLRPRQTQAPSASRGQPGRVVTDTLYDSRGLVVQKNEPWVTTGTPSTSVVVPAVAVPGRTRTVYDGAGRTTDEIVDVNEQERWRTTTTYGGDRTTVDPPAGAVPTTSILDARGRQVELRQYLGSAPTGTYQATTYRYDRSDQLTSVVDAAGNTWSYEYDVMGRQVASVDPDKGRTTSTYDDTDQLTSTTDARGTVLAYAYDKLGRPTEVREGSATGALRTSYAYDTLAKGQLTSATRHVGSAAYTTAVTAYDDAYRPLGQSVTVPSAEGALAGTYTTTYAYTPDGQVASTTLPAAGNLRSEKVTTRYDAANMPEWMGGGLGWGTYVAASVYSPYGEALLYDLGNTYSTQLLYAYEDGTRRLSRSWLVREEAKGFDRDVRYTYDEAGNPTKIVDTPTVPGALVDAQCFQYDGLNRLVDYWTPKNADCAAAKSVAALGGPAPYWKSYAYDAVGNRTQTTAHTASGDNTRTFAYPPAGGVRPHAVSTATHVDAAGARTAFTYGYDASGNTTSRPDTNGVQQTLTWDAEGLLASVQSASGTDAYVYDAGGQRLVRRQGGARTLYLPGGQEVTASATGVVTATRYYTFNGQTVAVRTGPKGNDVSTVVPDPQGTSEIVVSNVKNQLTQRRDDPFGFARGVTPTTWPGDRGYLNKPVDATGLVQMGARYYDALIGRFLSVDPVMDLGDPQQWAAYSYANNNPVTLSDPTGLWPSWGKSWIGKKFNSAKSSVGRFVSKYQAEIVGGIVGTAIGVGCLVGTAGWGSVACFAAAGAAGAAATNLWKTKVQKTQAFSWAALGRDMAIGAVVSGGTGALGKGLMAIPVVRGLVTSASQKASAIVSSATAKLSAATSRASTAAARGSAKPTSAAARSADDAAKPTQAKTESVGESCMLSFAGSTLVLMGDGSTKAIEDLKAGDEVIATDPETGEQKSRPIEQVWVHQDTLLDLEIDGEIVTTTEDHPFWSVTDATFERADELAPGELVLTADGRTVPVVGLRPATARTALAYNLSVADIHTYHVMAGSDAVLVHNCKFSERASEIHSAEPSSYVRDRVSTVAVIRADTGRGTVDVVAGSGDGLTASQMSAIRPGELVADNIPGAHAERNALLFINQMGWTPVAGGTSRNVCLNTCAALIRATGGRMSGEVFPGSSATTTRQRSFSWLE